MKFPVIVPFFSFTYVSFIVGTRSQVSVLEFDLGHFTFLDLGKRKEKKRGGGGGGGITTYPLVVEI